MVREGNSLVSLKALPYHVHGTSIRRIVYNRPFEVLLCPKHLKTIKIETIFHRGNFNTGLIHAQSQAGVATRFEDVFRGFIRTR